MRRLALTFALQALAACAGAPPRPGAAGHAEGAALELAAEYVTSYQARFPENATLVGFPLADHGAVLDNRPAAFQAWRAEEDRLLRRARALGELPVGSPGWIAHGLVLESLEALVAMRACRPELWGVRAQGDPTDSFATAGWQAAYADLAELQPVGTPELRRAAVDRLAALPTHVDQEVANLREGLRLGLAATSENVERVLGQLDALLALPASEWPFLAPAARDAAPGFREALEGQVAGRLEPATRRYRDFLRAEYLPRARHGTDLAGLPGGQACYRAAIREGTTLSLAPEAIHALGLERLAAIHAELRALGQRRLGAPDAAAVLHRLTSAPELRYRSGEEVLERARAAVARAEGAAGRAFARLPRGRVRVQAYPEAQARTGVVASENGSMVGDRYEGVFFVNTWDATRRSRLGDESTAFHEGWPGHHLQGALAAERPAGPLAPRYLWNNAYVEGWALYAERLADELGLYSSDEDRAGMLAEEAFRAARLVVDTGLHAFGWSRERAAAFLAEAAGGEPGQYLPEVDRYLSQPGQALGYLLGALEIRAAREEAQRALGDRFDLPAFHALVLDAPLPLPLLRQRVRAWLATAAPPG